MFTVLRAKDSSVVVAIIVSLFLIVFNLKNWWKKVLFRSKELDTIINSDIFDGFTDIYFFKKV